MSEASPVSASLKFIPIARKDILRELLYHARSQRHFDEDQVELFEKFNVTLATLYHYKFYLLGQRLLGHYAYFCSDNETLIHRQLTPKKQEKCKAELLQYLDILLQKANYQKLSKEELESVLKNMSSSSGAKEILGLEYFEQLELYLRPNPLQKNENENIYSRVCLVLRLRGETQLHLKLFKDIPKSQLHLLLPLEKLFPSSSPSGKASWFFLFFMICYVMLQTQYVTLHHTHLFPLGFLGIFMYVALRYSQKSIQKQLLHLNHHLYSDSIDHNFGVIHHLLYGAEEEEIKETLLAYYFLLTAPTPLTKISLTQQIQSWLQKNFKVEVSFDIEDSLDKLRQSKLIYEKENHLGVVDLQTAYHKLHQDWLKLFKQAQENIF